jgi:signal transduction histidine kinase
MVVDPKFRPWRREALKRGYKSSLSIPMLFQGKVLGAITIYSENESGFLDQELPLLSKFADDLAYGVSVIRFRNEKIKLDEQKKLLEIERARTEFITDATHELRTPLSIIKGNVDLALIKARKDSTGHSTVLSVINNEVMKMGEMISDLTLVTSKSEDYKKKTFEKHKVNISSLINNVVKRCGALKFKKISQSMSDTFQTPRLSATGIIWKECS